MGLFGPKLKKSELSDLLLNTRFNKNELKDGYEDFIKHNPSGNMWEESFILLLKQGFEVYLPQADPRNYCRILFKAFNLNKDYSLSFSEYMIGLSQAVRGTPDEKIDWSFRAYDQRVAGNLTYEDVLAVQKEIYNMYGTHYDLPEDEATAELKCQKIFTVLSKEYTVDTIDLDEFRHLCRLDYTLAVLDRPLEGLASRKDIPYGDWLFSRDFQGNRVIDIYQRGVH